MIDTSSLSPIRSRFEQLSQSEEGLRQSDRRCLALSHSARTVLQSARSAASTFLKEWINASLISEEDWSALPEPTQRKLVECPNIDDLLSELIELDLLTEYQAARLILGKTWGLILGSYRVLDRIGAGGMGVVFQAEHLYLRHTVAVKVLSQSIDQDFQLIQRFFTEMRAVALLRHPNIVAAMDGGVMRSSDSGQPDLYYFVMEHIPGEDLEEVVARQGPLEMTDACQIAHQVAMALSEVHKRQLVHRDIKPSNIRITPTNQIKLVDFGLVRHFSRQLTDVGSILGTLDYLAPEQAEDSRGVDIRADIYGLGGTLFWCLTGQTPFPSVGHPTQELLARLNQPPPSLLSYNPNLPPALDKLVKRMMASDREDRFSTPEALAQALSPFLEPTSTVSLPEEDLAQLPLEPKADLSPSTGRVLLVDDSGVSRHYYSHLLKKNTFHCKAVASGEEAIQVCREYKPSVVLADWVMSGMTGLELCQRLRKDPPTPNLKLILFSAQASDDDLAKTLTDVVDDYVIKN